MTTTTTAATPTAFGRFRRFFRKSGFALLCFDSFLSRFDLLLALDAIQCDLFSRGMFGLLRALLRLVDDDALKLFFFVEEVGDVKERITFESDVDESRLHAG